MDRNSINLETYEKKVPYHHQRMILNLYGWEFIDDDSKKELRIYLTTLVEQKISRKQVFEKAVEYCARKRIVTPYHYTLNGIVTEIFSTIDNNDLQKLDHLIQADHRELLDDFYKRIIGPLNINNKIISFESRTVADQRFEVEADFLTDFATP